MFKIYYYYKILQSIKSNNTQDLHIYLKKWNGSLFFNNIINFAISYNYKALKIIIDYMESRNQYFLLSFKRFQLRVDYDLTEIKKIFLEKLKNKNDYNQETITNNIKINILIELVKLNKNDALCELVKEINEKDKKDLFIYLFDGYLNIKSNPKIFDKIIDLFEIKKDLFDQKVFNIYSSLGFFINYDKFQYIINKYQFERHQFENLLLQTDNQEIIKYIIKNIDIRYRILILKVSKHLRHVYQYGSNEDMVEVILFYKKLNVLNDNLIQKSYGEEGFCIYLDYHYLNLIDLTDETKRLIIKNYLNGLILLSHPMHRPINENLINKVDNYFSYIDSVYPNLHDEKSLGVALDYGIQTSEELSVYFYNKYQNIFSLNSETLLKKFISLVDEVHQKNLLVRRICQENNQELKNKLLTTLVNKLSDTFFMSEKLSSIYFEIKNDIKDDLKIKLINKIIHQKDAISIIKDILNDSKLKDKLNLGEIFNFSISNNLTNANYLIDTYQINTIELSKAYLKLSYYKEDETYLILAEKIVKKDIILNETELLFLRENNYELFRIYNIYFLNKKLSQNLEEKGIKEKKIKI